MKSAVPNRIWAAGLLLCAATCGPWVISGTAQTDQTATTQLLGKAHALEVRGRMDMAKQTWQQVLLVDPNNSEALAGMARAAKLEGHNDEAQKYLDKMRALNPSDPNIARVEGMSSYQNTSAELQEAGKLAQAGQYARAMTILRQVYGDNPPAGDGALSYYQTEAATEDGRPHAIAGLRALVDKYPQDSRYQIALGKILTYNPRTRAEGRKLLERHPSSPDAQEALRQSLLWDAQNPATSSDIRAYLTRHKDQQLSTALAQTTAQAAASRRSSGPAGPRAPALTPEQQAAQAAFAQRSAADNAAYAQLNAHHIGEAETQFQAIIAQNPTDTQALAGLGYVRMQQANFGGAISYFGQAKQDGSRDPGVEKGLNDSRFFYTMQEATSALNENDLVTAQRQFTAALAMRQNDPQALLGLGGTLLKAQQPEPAVGVFTTYVRVKPADKAAWRGLFMADYGATHYQEALAVDRRVPAAIHSQLMRDPDYLRTLASVYSALGRDADAQRTLRSALELPFPAGGQGLKSETQLQYAALLAAANHRDQAEGLYKQVLTAEPNNTDAWGGLVQVQHAQGKDADAFQSIQSMPPAVLTANEQEPGFDTTVAAVYMSQGRNDMAQSLLESLLAKERQEGKKPFPSAQLQLAGLYLQRGNAQQAYPLYSELLMANPGRTDAWNGMLTGLHSSGHDQEALVQIQQIPPDVRRNLEMDPAYLQTVGSIYAGLGNPQEAQVFLNRVRQRYQQEGRTVPADADIQGAWLLYNAHNDVALEPALLALGARPDLTDDQRRTVQTIWVNFASRRAQAAFQQGNQRYALALLNAAAVSFPDNNQAARSLAGGYAGVGLPKRAVAIFRTQDMSRGTASDYEAAVGAALSDNDLRDAETWLRFGLDQYPQDPQMLLLAAKFEQARGDSGLAKDFYRKSLEILPRTDPGTQLANELAHLPPQAPVRRTTVTSQPLDLATLLSSPDGGMATVGQPVVTPRPYLPGSTAASSAPAVTMQPQRYATQPMYNNGSQQMQQPMYSNGSQSMQPQTMYSNGSQPMQQPQPMYSNGMTSNGTSSSGMMTNGLPSASSYGSYSAPGMSTPAVAPAVGSFGAPDIGGSSITSTTSTSSSASRRSKRSTQRLTEPSTTLKDYVPQSSIDPAAATGGILHLRIDPKMEAKYGPYVSYNPAEETPGMAQAAAWERERSSSPALRNVVFEQQASAYPQTTDGTPIVPYASVAKPATHSRTPSAAAKARAAQIKANQAAAPEIMTGVSHPPVDNYSADVQPAQYQTYGAGTQVTQPQQTTGSSLPATQPTGTGTQGTSSSTPSINSQTVPGSYGDSNGQQYPQPNTRGTSAPTVRRSRPRTQVMDQRQTAPMAYPSVQQQGTITNPGAPPLQQPYQLPPAPTDQQLIQQNIPPLRGSYYDPRIDPRQPLTAREQAELDLGTLEASYSGWLGGSVAGRYRSGTPGVDRLTSLEATFEASAVLGTAVRFAVIPKAVFLNSGNLATNINNTNPVLGTLPGNAVNPPQQQFASGVGGEVQAITNTFAVALGVTPYQFLVTNVIGRARWKPGNGHFTFYGGRDAVKETQLSYAGLRDPGSATTIYGGNVWGGVVQTGGGIRFDTGNENAGLYIQGEGADLSGFHTLENRKYDGTMGAYFKIKTWPEYGTLNIGGALFGEHYDHNERGETYGLGGYFSPEAYFLAAVPLTFTGHYGTNLHFVINGSVGLQTFQEDNQIYFPLDPAIQATYTIGCTTITNASCGQSTVNSNTGLNYAIDAQGSYRVNEHWYVGGFVSGNNTNNYNTISGGFYGRYLFRPQFQTVEYPTGLFPVEGFRPLKVP